MTMILLRIVKKTDIEFPDALIKQDLDASVVLIHLSIEKFADIVRQKHT